MEYLLVLPIPGSQVCDPSEVQDLEDRVKAALGPNGKVDGRDCGPLETNFLIMTRKPLEAFETLRGLEGVFDLRPELKAAYRQIDQSDFEVFYGQETYRFHIA